MFSMNNFKIEGIKTNGFKKKIFLKTKGFKKQKAKSCF